MPNPEESDLLHRAIEKLAEGFGGLPAARTDSDAGAAAGVLEAAAARMQDNYPYFHPLYAGQMLKPPHPVARIAYAMAMHVNPNNHALDGGRASSAMEKECIEQIGHMFDWSGHLGHLTGGGTMANLEALWVASRLAPGKKIVASEQAHYTHSRLTEVLGIPHASVPVRTDGRMDVDALEAVLGKGDVGAVVATIGTTGVGAVDPLPEILELRRTHGFRLHADAAYGGYFRLASGLEPHTLSAFAALGQADSIVIDPHKHGLQPYGCGCVLFRDPGVGRFYRHDSPYTYFSSAELHLGEISLECSRPGAAAVALWATMQLLPLVAGGAMAGMLDRCLAASRKLHSRLAASERYRPLMQPELDIVVYAAAAGDAAEASRRARIVFDRAAEQHLHLSLIELPVGMVREYVPELKANAERVTCLRSVLMKPEHEDWIDEIVRILESIGP